MTSSIDRRLERLKVAHATARRQQYYYDERGQRLMRERAGWQRNIKEQQERRRNLLMFEVERNQSTVRELLHGLAEHYADAALTGRLDAWHRAVNANVDLILDNKDKFKVAKRSEFP